jgi:hypothetical protein
MFAATWQWLPICTLVDVFSETRFIINGRSQNLKIATEQRKSDKDKWISLPGSVH